MRIVVGGYARISDVGELGDGRDGKEGVIRQQEDIHALVKGRGLSLGRMYVDNDLSAFKRRVVRPDYQDLVHDLEAGAVSGIAAYNIDRITRQPRELERIIDIYETARRPMVFATTAGDYDLATEDGRFNARLYVMIANKFSADAARRVARQKKATATSGQAHQGQRAFGWKQDGTVEDWEAALIDKSQLDILNGKLLSEVHAEWAELGVRGPQTPPGKTLSYSSVRYILTNPRLCGYRAYIPVAVREQQGRVDPWEHILERTDGTPVIGEWDKVSSADQVRAVVDVLNARKPKGRGRKKGSTVTVRKLTGTSRCGDCGHGMTSGQYTEGTSSFEQWGYYYHCKKSEGGCGKMSRCGPPIEDLVDSALLARLQQAAKGSKPQKSQDDPALVKARKELAQVEADMAEARQLRESGEFPLGEFVREISRLETKRDELSASVSTMNVMGPQTGVSAAERILREWDGYTIPMQRSVISRFVEAVVIKKQGKGGNHEFRPELIEIVWK
ncbi:recombinase family protein [Kitasatospora sp. NPDC097643]|uniref:recombinase family protein n=1 Tax=Kitasatospora sp. NPDC097643 TaxID=3157230 RepID=UPI003323B128